jgi:PAS domain S-box-containing protein
MDANGFSRVAEAMQRLRGIPTDLLPSEQRGQFAAAVADLNRFLQHAQARGEAPGRPEVELETAYRDAQVYLTRYRELFECAAHGYLVTDAKGIILEANEVASDLLQSRKEFLKGKPFAFLLAEGDRRAFYDRLTQLREHGASDEAWEARLRTRRGEQREVLLAVNVIPAREGQPVGLRWLLQDVTRQKEVERAFRAQKQFADSLVNAVPAIILVVDFLGRIVRSNPFAHAVSGYGPDELLGRDWRTLLPADASWRRARSMHDEALRLGTVQSGLHGLVTRAGTRREVSWTATRLASVQSEAALLLLGHDITDLQEAQQHALRAERLAAIGQMMTGLAHESRNALQRGTACLAMLRHELAGQEQALDLVQRTEKALDDLHRLYEEVRQFAAPINLDRSPWDLGGIWQEAWDQLARLHTGRDVQLHEQTSGLDLVCDVDRFRLLQVFRNLFENALTACPDPVRITVVCAADDLAGGPALRLAVRDNGPGVPAKAQAKVFDPFFTTKPKGTGLGLAIVKRIVEAHGGKVAVGSPGPGAEFLITLPRRNP